MPIKLMVSSTVYNFEDQLTQICGTLEGYGYRVLNSHYGTIRPRVGQSNADACLAAVEECDYFLGIIRGRYGSGITHQELTQAIGQDKPRMFLVEQKVDHARQLLVKFAPVLPDRVFQADGAPLFSPGANPFKGNAVLDDYRVIAMLEEALLSMTPFPERHDHWCQFFSTQTNLLRMLETRFSDHDMLEAELSATRGGTP